MKKSLGQHWLYDKAALTAMCEAAAVSSDNVVLEIGPGQGTLTAKLLERGARVTAVEKDTALAKTLPYHISYLSEVRPWKGELVVEEGDILGFDLRKMSENYKIVANIPYYLTSKLIRTISGTSNRPSVAVLLVQKEVAERVVAGPGDMSLLSVTAQFYWKVNKGRVVKAELFTPPPKVDSQILVLKRRSQPMFDVDEKLFFRLVKTGFAARRKTLLNSISGGLRISKDRAGELLEKADIDPGLRPQSLPLPRWFDLYKAAETMNMF